MPTVTINLVAFVVAVVINLGVAGLWYGPWSSSVWAQFGGSRQTRIKPNDRPAVLVAALLFAVLESFILVHFVRYVSYFYPNYSDVAVGLMVGSWLWVGLVVPTLAGARLLAGGRKRLLALDATYALVVLLINGVLLSIWH